MEDKNLPQKRAEQMNQWAQLAQDLWRDDKHGPWPAFGMITLGYFLAPVLVGLPMMLLGVVKLFQLWTPKPPQ